jgi:tRNA(Ile)-lysidine synthase
MTFVNPTKKPNPAPNRKAASAGRGASTKLHPFEFRVLRGLQAAGLEESLAKARILVACSGGMDSVALVLCMAALSKKLGFGLVVGHVHHGSTPEIVQRTARTRAMRVARQVADGLAIGFLSARSAGKGVKALGSEEALRDFRLGALKKMALGEKCTHIAFAHHADDLLETRLIRLARGTGAQGLAAMHVSAPGVLRPFLKEARSAIEAYAKDKSLSWVEDPSNRQTEPLRNWMRQVWLPQLEAKRPGALRALARSLEIIVDELGEERAPQADEVSIGREDYLELGIHERRKLIARFLLQLDTKAFAASHVEEIRKRIETTRKNVKFQILRIHWDINAKQIRAHR